MGRLLLGRALYPIGVLLFVGPIFVFILGGGGVDLQLLMKH